MKKFWPGPLTFVLEKKTAVPDVVTAGGSTVAVRIPKHPAALSLIKKAGYPIAAPSANLAGKPSPTSAVHVAEDLGKSVDLILDGGSTHHGLESTVIDVTRKRVEILRSGAITAEMLEKVLGYKPKTIAHGGIEKKAKQSTSARTKKQKALAVRSPGLKYRHYAPSVKLYLVVSKRETSLVKLIQKQIRTFQQQGLRVGVLCSTEHQKFYLNAQEIVGCGSRKNLAQVARKLFDCLRSFDPKNVDVIIAESFPTAGIGHAIMDKLSRAATKKI